MPPGRPLMGPTAVSTITIVQKSGTLPKTRQTPPTSRPARVYEERAPG